jgi:hypothetical protein
MSTHILTTPREAEELLARTFQAGSKLRIEAREDKAFKDDGWLNLGEFVLDATDRRPEQLIASVRRGGFVWTVPSAEDASKQLKELLGLKDKGSDEAKLRRALDAIAAISLRVGLQHPRFDPQALEEMPFRRSTTVVSDTSGAVQGGLDFVARHLHPAARVKVPAIVQMEIVNFAERFLSNRRSARTRSADLLIDHLLSQGGQRVLLRLELQADTEIERTFLLGDPLRSAFQRDVDPDLDQLSLSASIRAYVDRLILESARHHQAQANPGHRVQLLTSDQGLARMALGEGITPLYFVSVVASDFFGRRFTGATLNPFSGRLLDISLASLAWEYATAFGSLRLTGEDEEHVVVVSAFGDGMSWSPYQSHADLLWCDHQRVPPWPKLDHAEVEPPKPEAPPPEPKKSPPRGKLRKPPAQKPAKKAATKSDPTQKSIPLQRFNAARLFDLIDRIDNDQAFSEDRVIETLQATSRDGIEEYRRFLTSGGLVDVNGGDWTANDATREMAVALRNEDTQTLRELLARTPAFSLFVDKLQQLSTGEVLDPGAFTRTLSTYRLLGEVTEVCAPVFGKGVFATLNRPDIRAFAPLAVARFAELDRGEGLVATGAWLEALIEKEGIHPEVARNRVNDASAAGLLRRSTEGSTTDTRFDNHIVHVLRSRGGKPAIEQVRLYRGDYLIPGKSSTSIRIEGP